MAEFEYDLFVVGAGSGGVACARRAATLGARAALCEDDRIGGTCVNRGCVPKKLLVYAAHFRDEIEDSVGYGWRSRLPTFDWGELIANKDKEIDRLNGIYRSMLETAGADYIVGRGELLDGHTVRVGRETYTARHIVIATGARPWRPETPGVEHTITSDDVFHLAELPRRLIVVGGGYIAVEFAGIFHNLGTQVTMLVRAEELLNGFDDDVRIALAQEMRKRGIEIHTRCQPRRVDSDGRSVEVEAMDGRVFDADRMLYATGRVPNTGGIGLAEAGVKLAPNGAVVVDADSRSTAASVYAVGDCTDRKNLTPVAIVEGRAIAEALFGGRPAPLDYDLVPTAVFSQPPLSGVGLTEAEALRRHRALDIYTARFKPMKHTLSGRDETCFMKLIVDKGSERVLGCHMVGLDAPEIIQGIAVALTCGATKAQFDATVAIHPTTAEELVLLRAPTRSVAREAAQ